MTFNNLEGNVFNTNSNIRNRIPFSMCSLSLSLILYIYMMSKVEVTQLDPMMVLFNI